MAKRPAARKNKRTVSKPTAKAITAIAKKVVAGESETKYRTYYSGGVGGVTDPGDRAAWAFVLKNQFINSNTTDIHRLIPPVLQGVGENTRIGNRINPTSLIVNGTVTVTNASLIGLSGKDMYVVLYVLQHVSLKDYTVLAAQNNFNQMLLTGESATQQYGGIVVDSMLKINDKAYRLLARKTIPIRYAGQQLNAAPVTNITSIANAHDFHRNFSFNLGKKIPKTLLYPEDPTKTDPTNSSIFMCASYYLMGGMAPGAVPDSQVNLQYVSHLYYKDL